MAEGSVKAAKRGITIAVVTLEHDGLVGTHVGIIKPAMGWIGDRSDIGHTVGEVGLNCSANNPVALIVRALIAQCERDVLRWRCDRAPDVEYLNPAKLPANVCRYRALEELQCRITGVVEMNEIGSRCGIAAARIAKQNARVEWRCVGCIGELTNEFDTAWNVALLDPTLIVPVRAIERLSNECKTLVVKVWR